MPTLAHPFEEPTFRESLAGYVTVTCHRYRMRPADAFDLVQEALTQIIASFGSFRPEKGEFDAWARGVALNVIRQHARAAKRYSARFSEVHPNMDEHAAPEPSPEWCVRRKQARCAITNAAENLQQKVPTTFEGPLRFVDLGHRRHKFGVRSSTLVKRRPRVVWNRSMRGAGKMWPQKRCQHATNRADRALYDP